MDKIADIYNLYPDLIKIDVQGEGTLVLKSAGEDIIKIKNIILGTHGKEHNQCLDLLKRYGFKIKLNREQENNEMSDSDSDSDSTDDEANI